MRLLKLNYPTVRRYTMYKMVIDFPNLAKGAEVQILGLGIFSNGDTHIIDDDAAQNYRDHNTSIVEDFDEDGAVVGRHTEQGPTLLQAFHNHTGVTVEVAEGKREKPKDAPPPADNTSKPKDDSTPEGGDS